MTLKDVENFLGTKAKKELVEMFMEHVTSDERLRRQLMLQIAARSAKWKGLDAYRSAIEQVTETGRYIDYRQVSSFAVGVDQVVDSMREMLDNRPDDLIELCEFAITRVEQALQSVDDSGGYLGTILGDIQALHLQACRKGKPEPKAFASRLFRLAIESEWDSFDGAYTLYATVLGREGRGYFRELAERKWAALPKLGPGDRRERGGRFRITSIMKEIARESRDIDRLVEIESHDLSSSYAYLTIAGTYRDAGRFDEALHWAEQGMSAFSSEPPDRRLVEFLIDEYSRRGARDNVMALAWDEFQRMTTIDGYRTLKKRAGREWKQWRPRAIDHARDTLRNTRLNVAGSKWLHARPDHSLLVQIYLEEKDTDAAWQAAVEGGCSEGVWMNLAESREKSHPDDALAIYRRNVDRLADAGDYRGATALLLRIRRVMKRSTADADFPEYLAALRAENKRRRNFIKLLDVTFSK